MLALALLSALLSSFRCYSCDEGQKAGKKITKEVVNKKKTFYVFEKKVLQTSEETKTQICTIKLLRIQIKKSV